MTLVLEAQFSQPNPLHQIAIRLALYGLLRSDQSVVVWPGAIAPEDDGISLSIPGFRALLVVMTLILLVEMEQELLEIQEKK